MRIFLSYASSDRAKVEPVYLSLSAERRHEVFFDRASLPPGEAFDARIRAAIERADLFVFFVSPDAMDAGSYTLSELATAQQTWPHPAGQVLPILLAATAVDTLPAYLKAVTLLEPTGNLNADVANAVARIEPTRERARQMKSIGALGVVILLCAAAALVWHRRDVWLSRSPALEMTGKDGAPMRLIPGGAFIIGDDEEAPKREIYLDAFYIDTFEVSVARYAAFMQASGNVHAPEGWPEDPGKVANLPVVGVDWRDAEAYCKWAGKRLPTDAEWEKAAHDNDERLYPWGNDSPTPERAALMKTAEKAYTGGLDPIGSHPSGASSAGVQDLAGNASEWVADWYAESFARDDVRNPKGPESGTERVIRGGGWQDGGTRLK